MKKFYNLKPHKQSLIILINCLLILLCLKITITSLGMLFFISVAIIYLCIFIPYLIWLHKHSNMYHIKLKQFEYHIDHTDQYNVLKVIHKDMIKFYKKNVTTKNMGNDFRLVYMKLKLKLKSINGKSL